MGRYLKWPFGSVLCTHERPLEIQYNTIQYNTIQAMSLSGETTTDEINVGEDSRSNLYWQ